MPTTEAYRKRKAEGLCPMCGGQRDSAKVLCAECRAKQTAKYMPHPLVRLPLTTEEKQQKTQRQRGYSLKHQYNLTLGDYQTMLEAQEGRCALCGRERSLVVDHDHNTGLVRGLLCQCCNTGLGKLGDSKAGLLRALAYLEATT